MPNNSISVVIPLFNEAKRIGATLKRIEEYQKDFNLIKEIILINDGSSDNTLGKINEFRNFSIPVKLFKNNINMGKGYSVKRGVNESSGEAVLFMDADNSVDIGHLNSFVQYLGDFDIVIGSIEISGSNILKDENHPIRRKLGHISKKLISITALYGIADSQRGFKLFSKRSAQIVFSKQRINRWGFDIEILLIAQKHNFKIKELPVIWNNPKSTSVELSSYITTLFELFFIKWNDIRGLYK